MFWNWDNLCNWSHTVPHSSRQDLLCITVSQIVILFFFFLPDNPMWTCVFQSLQSREHCLWFHGGGYPPFPLLLSVSILKFPRGTEMSLAHFLSFCQGQTGGTPVGFTLTKKKSFLHFLCQSSPLLFSQGQGHFQQVLPFLVTTARHEMRSRVSSWIVMQTLKCMDILGMSITAFILLHRPLFLKCQRWGSLNKTSSVYHSGRIYLPVNSIKWNSHDTPSMKLTGPFSDFWNIYHRRDALCRVQQCSWRMHFYGSHTSNCLWSFQESGKVQFVKNLLYLTQPALAFSSTLIRYEVYFSFVLAGVLIRIN